MLDTKQVWPDDNSEGNTPVIVGSILRRKRSVEVPAQTQVESQIRPHTPIVLDVGSEFRGPECGNYERFRSHDRRCIVFEHVSQIVACDKARDLHLAARVGALTQ